MHVKEKGGGGVEELSNGQGGRVESSEETSMKQNKVLRSYFGQCFLCFLVQSAPPLATHWPGDSHEHGGAISAIARREAYLSETAIISPGVNLSSRVRLGK